MEFGNISQITWQLRKTSDSRKDGATLRCIKLWRAKTNGTEERMVKVMIFEH